MKSNYKKLGQYIQTVSVKNRDLKVTNLLGVSLKKVFIPSIANTIGTDMSKYKVVKKNQFTYGSITSRNGDKISIALLEDDEAIVSTSYTVFEIIDTTKLLPEYLMMWFRRDEFDRYARFMSHGSTREAFGWEEMCDVQLPVPSIEKQQEIVDEYNTIVDRIKLNEQLNQKLEEMAQAIYKQWFVDFEFPNSEGKPYKSSGGKMVYCEELDIEIPEGWTKGYLKNLFELQRGFDLPIQNRNKGKYPIYASTGIIGYHNEYKVKAPCIVTGRSGSLGEVFYIEDDFWALNTTLWIKSFHNSTPLFSYFILKSINLLEYNSGSAVPTLNRNYLHMHSITVPRIEIINQFEILIKKIFKYKKVLNSNLKKMYKLKQILFSKLATIKE